MAETLPFAAARHMTRGHCGEQVTGKSGDVRELLRKREQLKEDLQRVEKQLNRLDTSEPAFQLSQSSASGTAEPARTSTGTRRTIPATGNDRSLRQVVEDVLQQQPDGMSLNELTQAVLDAGYKTNATNFRNVVYQHIYHSRDVMSPARGRYALAKHDSN
jgi:hypothetical protein